MSYQANLDIVIALSSLHVRAFHKQGTLRFKVSLFLNTHTPDNPTVPCPPYNIYQLPRDPKDKYWQSQGVRPLVGMVPGPQKERMDSHLDHDEECYYSRSFESKMMSQEHPINEVCYFRKYLSVHLLQQATLQLRVQLFFRPQGSQQYTEAGLYEGNIHKLSGLSTYLPVAFDEFGSFKITGSYQATILEYRFGCEDGSKREYSSFEDYLSAATHKFRAKQFLDFFSYYRGSLEQQLMAIQEHHLDLLKVVAPQQLYPWVKLNPNEVIYGIADCLDSSQGSLKPHSLSITPNHEDIRDRACFEISKDFTAIKGIIYQKWNDYILFMSGCLPQAIKYLSSLYRAQEMERLKTHAFSHRVEKNWDWTFSRYQDSGKTYLEQAKLDKLKKKEEVLWRDHFPIESKNHFEQQAKNIKIFQQIFQVQGSLLTKRSNYIEPGLKRLESIGLKRLSSSDNIHPFSPRSHIELAKTPSRIGQASEFGSIYTSEFGQIEPMLDPRQSMVGLSLEKSQARGQHLVIFVHGFQASKQDFVLFKNCLEIRFGCRVFVSSTNEGRTDDSIETMGKRLAIEVNNLFKTVEFGPTTRISFVGHSMGGIIIRSALSYIKNLQSYLFSYMSFSSPHLGYLYEPSALVQAGLWLLNAWEKVPSLDELCMRDSSDLRNTLLYRLSENNSLKGFKQLALISSSQDEYVPYESARIQKNTALFERLNHPSPTIIREMVDNLLGELEVSQLSRINVVFNIEDKSFDSWVGRTAHIKYLSDQKFIKMFCLVFQKFFA